VIHFRERETKDHASTMFLAAASTAGRILPVQFHRCPLLSHGCPELAVALTPLDRELLRRCLHHEPGAWNDFIDRFLGLVYHVIQHTAHLRSYDLRPEDTEDIAAQVLLEIVDNDYAVLRHFRGHCSLATYLTVVARRTCVQELVRRAVAHEADIKAGKKVETADNSRPHAGLESLEEVTRLLRKLPAKERSVVKLYYLEGRSYEEISTLLDIPINSIGPILTRARKKLEEKKPH
jgi:RNA polymerase sigma-70 factor (ECF subfamily)